MEDGSYVSFYTSRPFWAVDSLDLNSTKTKDNFYALMSEVTYQKDTNKYKLAICRDGRVMLYLKPDVFESNKEIDDITKWSVYLNYLNSFYLLLDSSVLQLNRIAYFNLHEITSRDAFTFSVKEGRLEAEQISMESVASIYQSARFLSSYKSELPFSIDSRHIGRQLIDIAPITQAFEQFDSIFSNAGLEIELARTAKSIGEYKIGNYESSIVLAWFTCEKILRLRWQQLLERLNCTYQDGSKKLNSIRLNALQDSTYTISIITNMLELHNDIDIALFKNLEKVRTYRNNIAHGDTKYQPKREHSDLAINSAIELIRKTYSLSIKPNLNFQTSGVPR